MSTNNRVPYGEELKQRFKSVINMLKNDKISPYPWEDNGSKVFPSCKENIRIIEETSDYLRRRGDVINTDRVILNYSREVWVSEHRIYGDTLELVSRIMHNTENLNEDEIVSYIRTDFKYSDSKSIEIYKTIRNIVQASRFMFDGTRTLDMELSEEFSNTVHQMITRDIVAPEKCGRLRTTDCQNTDTLYVGHESVRPQLRSLFEVVNYLITRCELEENPMDRIVLRIAIGSVFFERFLMIHPYTDGNGRVARLLFSHLMRDKRHVLPISLYLPKKGAYKEWDVEQYEKYVLVLRRSRKDPSVIVRYVVDCMSNHIDDLNQAFARDSGFYESHNLDNDFADVFATRIVHED